MKLGFLKKILATSALLIASLSFAAPNGEGVTEYKIVKAEYAPAHVKNALDGKLNIDYAARTITLRVESAPPCPAGMICPQVLKVLSVVLPIVSENTDSCGFHKVVAKLDKQHADGMLQEITVQDVIKQTCPTIVPVIPQATYLTSFYNQQTGKKVTNVSRLTLALANSTPETAPIVLVKYQMNIGFSPNPSVRTVTIDSNGNVNSQVEFYKTHKVVKSTIAKLSAEGLATLNTKLTTIPVDAKLVDPNEGQPLCMDAPSSNVVVYVGDLEVELLRIAGCHEAKSYDGEATDIVSAMMGFVSLAR